jgi:chromosome segregation ATPase
MTIKFERVNMLGPWTKDESDLTHYKFYKVYDHDEPNKKYDIWLSLTNSEFEKLFKDMAKELGYMIIGRHGAIINTKNMNEEEKTKYKEAYEDLQAVQKVIRYKENTPKVDKSKIEKILNDSEECYKKEFDKETNVKTEFEHKLELRLDKLVNRINDLEKVIHIHSDNDHNQQRQLDKLEERIKILEDAGTNRDKKEIEIDQRLDKLQEAIKQTDERVENRYLETQELFRRVNDLEVISTHLKDMNNYRQKQIEINKRHVEMLVNQDKRIDELKNKISDLTQDLDWDE